MIDFIAVAGPATITIGPDVKAVLAQDSSEADDLRVRGATDARRDHEAEAEVLRAGERVPHGTTPADVTRRRY
jgi:hypothetical protein